MEDWIGASVWRMGQTAEDRLKYRRSVMGATSGNGYAKERHREREREREKERERERERDVLNNV